MFYISYAFTYFYSQSCVYSCFRYINKSRMCVVEYNSGLTMYVRDRTINIKVIKQGIINHGR
jgi:hypothetical protein